MGCTYQSTKVEKSVMSISDQREYYYCTQNSSSDSLHSNSSSDSQSSEQRLALLLFYTILHTKVGVLHNRSTHTNVTQEVLAEAASKD